MTCLPACLPAYRVMFSGNYELQKLIRRKHIDQSVKRSFRFLSFIIVKRHLVRTSNKH